MSEDVPGELVPALEEPVRALDEPAPDQPGLPVPRWLGPTFLLLAALTVPWAVLCMKCAAAGSGRA